MLVKPALNVIKTRTMLLVSPDFVKDSHEIFDLVLQELNTPSPLIKQARAVLYLVRFR